MKKNNFKVNRDVGAKKGTSRVNNGQGALCFIFK